MFCLSIFNLWAQDNPVNYSWEAKPLGNNEYEIIFKAKIKDGWYTYSQFLESMDGPIPTSVNFESNNEEKVGKPTEKTSKADYKVAGFDEMFDMNITKYKHDLTITQKIKAKDPKKAVSGYLEFMTCDNTRCMPPASVEFSFVPADLDKKNGKAETTTVTTPSTNTTIDNPSPGANNGQPVTWVFNFKKVSDNEVDLVATATIAEGWYVYSQKLPSADGPVATSINFNPGATATEVSNVESTSVPENKLQGMDEVFKMEVTKYKHDFTITKRIKVTDPTKDITGFLEFMTCDASKCMPPTPVEFTFSFSGGKSASTYGGTVVDGKFNPERPVLISTNKKPLGNCETAEGEAISGDMDVATMSWLTIFILGFGSGLVALLTPCVFPMIPMTVSLFSKGKKKKKGEEETVEEARQRKMEGIKNALTFGASIIVIYVTLGMAITLIFGEDALNQLSTNWLMNTIFFVLFSVFAFSFFGYFEITLPASLVNKVDAASNKGGLIGTFFGAFSIALVSFSCTGPIIGSLLAAAVSSGPIAPTIGMLGFSIGLALPFTLFAAFPHWLQSLPNSGSWMTSMKVILGFLELALGLKFLSTADLTEHWGILPYELFVGLWALIFGAMTLYLFGLIRFPHDNPMQKISNARKGLGVFAGILTISILSGFLTNSQTNAFRTPFWLSGLAPSACYSYVKPCNNEATDADFKFSDHCPPGINQCFDDYDEAMRYAQKVNKPVLIDFTGYGCVNCRWMEEHIWIDSTVNKMLNDDYVLVSLYVDDRKKLDQILEAPDGSKVRNVGNKWAAFQNVNFSTQTQPYYVLVSTDEKVLNQPRGYTPELQTYTAFLKCGLKTFSELKK